MTMSHTQPNPGRRRRIIGWSVFVLLLVIFGMFLAKLPPQPRTSFELPKDNDHQDIILQLFTSSVVTFSILDPALGTCRGPIQIWDTNTGQCKQGFLDGIDFHCYKFSPSHRFLAINDWKGSLHLLDLRSDLQRRQILPGFVDLDQRQLIFSPAEKYLLVLDNKDGEKSYLIETQTGIVRQKMRGFLDFHRFSAKDEVFVFATEGYETGICHLDTGAPSRLVKNTRPFALAPDGRHLFACKDGHIVLLDIPAGKCQSITFEHDTLENSLFSPDSKLLACAFTRIIKQDPEVFVHEVIFFDVTTGSSLGKPIRVPSSFSNASFLPDSKALLLKGNPLVAANSKGICWQTEEVEDGLGDGTFDQHRETIGNSDSSFLVTWIHLPAGLFPSHEYEVIDLAAGAMRRSIELDPRSTAALSQNGKYLVVREENNQEPSFLPACWRVGGRNHRVSRNR
jgi:hypothetical protein